MKFSGVTILQGGRISHFSYSLCMGLTTAALLRCLWYYFLQIIISAPLCRLYDSKAPSTKSSYLVTYLKWPWRGVKWLNNLKVIGIGRDSTHHIIVISLAFDGRVWCHFQETVSYSSKIAVFNAAVEVDRLASTVRISQNFFVAVKNDAATVWWKKVCW